jgi:hypothetical protein
MSSTQINKVDELTYASRLTVMKDKPSSASNIFNGKRSYATTGGTSALSRKMPVLTSKLRLKQKIKAPKFSKNKVEENVKKAMEVAEQVQFIQKQR